MRRGWSYLLALLAVLGLAACGRTTRPRPSEPPPLSPRATVEPTRTSPPTIPPATPTLTAVPTSTPPPTPTLPPCSFDPQVPILWPNLLVDTILFTRLNDDGWMQKTELWAVSPDGHFLGRLSAERESVGVYAPSEPPPQLVLLTSSAISLTDALVQLVYLPPECNPSSQGTGDWPACSDYSFSPDGRWAAFLWGDLGCSTGRMGAIIENLSTGQALRWEGRGEVGRVEFLPNGRALVPGLDCEGGHHYSLWDPQSGYTGYLGSDLGGWLLWNVDRSAFAGEKGGTPFHGWQSIVWTYNWVLDVFAYEVEGDSVTPRWTLDGTHLLYEYRDFTVTGGITYTFGPREIHAVNASSGEVVVLAGNRQHDYYLEESSWRGDWVWQGDWIGVQRCHYQLQECEFPMSMDGTCFNESVCSDTPERLALNWRTGELQPWEQIPLSPPVSPTPRPRPTLTPTPIPGPDLSSTPLYTDPGGRYVLYVGMDGQSLWCVREGEPPVRWIEQGYHFVYIP